MRTNPEHIRNLRALMSGLDPSAAPRAAFVKCALEGIRCTGQSLLILDASFNPLTLAHTRMVELASAVCPPHEIVLMLSRANVDKDVFGADLGQRLAMLLPYAAGQIHTSIIGCSHARFVDKADALRPLYPEATRTTFIIGHDTLRRLFDRKYYADMEGDLDRLFAGCGFVAANRGSLGLEAMQDFMRRPACRPYAGRVHLIHLEAPYADMSSTQVREQRRQGRPIRDVVPEAIAEAIDAMGLYLT